MHLGSGEQLGSLVLAGARPAGPSWHPFPAAFSRLGEEEGEGSLPPPSGFSSHWGETLPRPRSPHGCPLHARPPCPACARSFPGRGSGCGQVGGFLKEVPAGKGWGRGGHPASVSVAEGRTPCPGGTMGACVSQAKYRAAAATPTARIPRNLPGGGLPSRGRGRPPACGVSVRLVWGLPRALPGLGSSRGGWGGRPQGGGGAVCFRIRLAPAGRPPAPLRAEPGPHFLALSLCGDEGRPGLPGRTGQRLLAL